MRLIGKYDEFCQLYDEGKVFPDVHSHLGRQSVGVLIKKGWEKKDGK